MALTSCHTITTSQPETKTGTNCLTSPLANCLTFASSLISLMISEGWRPVGELNPCSQRERLVS